MSRLAWVYGDGIHLTVVYISLLFKFQSQQWCCRVRVMIDALCALCALCAVLQGMRERQNDQGR
ncbi:hypothetical protein CK911_15220 [Aeromonas sp. CU5]|nr:hypothetical protein CK911_15220 [Aeromonas sp. CU5]